MQAANLYGALHILDGMLLKSVKVRGVVEFSGPLHRVTQDCFFLFFFKCSK